MVMLNSGDQQINNGTRAATTRETTTTRAERANKLRFSVMVVVVCSSFSSGKYRDYCFSCWRLSIDDCEIMRLSVYDVVMR